MHRRITQAAAVLMILALLITGCTSQASNIGMAKDKANNVVDTGFSVNTVGSYDSADTAVVVGVDQGNNAVTLMNMGADRQYTLYYDGTTYVEDKYGGPMTISQIQTGDVVDVFFLKGKRQIASIQLSPEAWIYDNVKNYNLGGLNKTANIGSTTYSLPDNVVIFSEGKRAEVMDIVDQDVISIHGVGHDIYSINVDRGHGYLRLKNDQALIGGWIEVGNTVIREISEDMLLVVPEGSYQVFLSNEGVSAKKDVVIERNKEIVLDVGDLEIARDKTGRILISVTPEDAEVKIDGKDVDISSAVELPYGIHQVHLEADGYDSLTKYIQVGSEYAKISFTMEKKKEPVVEDSVISGNNLVEEEPVRPEEYEKELEPSISENTIKPSSGNKVYIDSPEDVEVYVDSNYIGISPVSFKKTVGSHTVTLRKSGYVTKSYTIYLYNDGEDITYSFSDLEKENTASDNKSTGSNNSTSNKTVSGNESDTSTSSSSTSTSSSQTTETDDPNIEENPDDGDNVEGDGPSSDEDGEGSGDDDDNSDDDEDDDSSDDDDDDDSKDDDEDDDSSDDDDDDNKQGGTEEDGDKVIENSLYYGNQIGKKKVSGQVK